MNVNAGYTSLLALQAELPPEWDSKGLRQEIRRINDARGRKIIVLDDDPTGVQTVHDIDVLTQWDEALLREAFDSPETLFIS